MMSILNSKETRIIGQIKILFSLQSHCSFFILSSSIFHQIKQSVKSKKRHQRKHREREGNRERGLEFWREWRRLRYNVFPIFNLKIVSGSSKTTSFCPSNGTRIRTTWAGSYIPVDASTRASPLILYNI